MKLDEYADWAETIHSKATGGAHDKHNDRLLSYLALGLTSEAGEVASAVKKLLRDGTLDMDNLVEELGDVMYHWVRLVMVTGRTPAEIMAASRAKIDARVKVSR
jgi:NTP pyrophosphatase (non-canonical NTP hydrolase)